MPVDPRTAVIRGLPSVPVRPEMERPAFFTETLPASFGYTYDPAFEYLYNKWAFPEPRSADYNPLNDISGYEMYATHLVDARSPEHMASLKRGIDESLARRDVLSRSSLLSQLGAGLLDPLNLVALPLGGPTVGILRSTSRVAIGSAMIQAGVEGALIQPFDAVQTAEESALNIGAAFLFGGALGGVASVPVTRRARAMDQFRQQLNEHSALAREIEQYGAIEQSDLLTINKPDLRYYGSDTADSLTARLNALTTESYRLEDSIARSDNFKVREELDQVLSEINIIRKEQGIRLLEEKGFDPNDAMGFASNAFTDSIAYKFVSTPFKRIMQSNVAAPIKNATLKLANDSGLTMAFNSILNVASSQSVSQRAMIRHGYWAKANDDLIQIYREAFGLKDTSLLDIDPLNSLRSIVDPDRSYSGWLKTINEKRVKGLEFTASEKNAAKILDDYFKRAEKELIENGLIGDPASLSKRIKRIDEELDGLSGDTSAQGIARKGALRQKKEDLSFELAIAKDSPPELSEAWFPRIYDKAYILKNRDRFTEIIRQWYSENPEVWELTDTGDWVKRTLSRDEADVSARASETVATILGEVDPVTSSIGSGRRKHFRSRIDIPNALIWDFIIKDPLAVMKGYEARVGPTVEFHKAFGGKDIEEVIHDLDIDMIKQGLSYEERNRHLRDFRHLYDSISGTVLRNPDSWDQKVAFALTQAATFNYMGSAGLSAFPDMARVIAEHELRNIAKAIDVLVDKDMRGIAVKEARQAGEAIDFLKNSSVMRLMEDLSNDIMANDFWNKANSAFYVLNGLTPLTQIAKTLDGIVAGHEIIETSLRLKDGTITPQDRVKMARMGIPDEQLRKIAEAPWFETKNGLYIANTESWADNISIPEIDGKRINVIEINEDGSPVGKTVKGRYVPAFYNDKTKTIKFDRDYIEGEMYDSKAWANPKVEGVKALPEDSFLTRKSWSNFVMLHEIMHSRLRPEDLDLDIPSPKEGYTRVYRFSGDGRRKDVPDWMKENPDYQQMLKATGRWFTDDIEEAKWYIREHPEGQLKYVDIPTSSLEDFRVSNIVETPDGLDPRKFSARPQKELFLSPKFSDMAKPYGELTKVAYENKINELAWKELQKAEKATKETVNTFRSALNSSILNTIMSATPADKPISVSGVFYIPMRIAKQFGMTEDSKYRGYARIENGLLRLPFQFYNYALANVNKTVGAFAHGQLKNQTVAAVTALTLGYMSVKLKTPDFAWQEMDYSDRFGRAFDASGMAAMYSGLFYTALHTSLALGGPNITGGIIQPKFPVSVDYGRGAVGLLGAGPSIGYDLTAGAYKFAFGDNRGEGAKEVFRNLPFARMWFWKDQMNAMTRAWGL